MIKKVPLNHFIYFEHFSTLTNSKLSDVRLIKFIHTLDDVLTQPQTSRSC